MLFWLSYSKPICSLIKYILPVKFSNQIDNIQRQLIIQRINKIQKNINTMHLFNKFKTYLHPSAKQNTDLQPEKYDRFNNSNSSSKSKGKNKSLQKSNDSFELIMLDILEVNQPDMHKKQHRQSEEIYQDLVYEVVEEQQEHEGIQNMYLKDFIFVNKLSEARQLTVPEWNQMVEKRNLSLYPKKNIYFSILKGIKFQVRKKVWQLFANTAEMKKMTARTYKQLIQPENIRPQILSQIDKDVPRSKSVTNYTKELRNILVGYCSLTKKQYTQGMNLIAGSLLTLLALENDEQLSSFQILEKTFEERVFWIFIGVMIWKNWQDIFDANFQGLTKRLEILEGLMAEHVPAIYQKLIDFEWDLTIFSQYYITIMLYNTPREFSKIILDLFFLDGENAIHSLIIRMMKLQEDRILGFSDECELMGYFKKEMINDCYLSVKKNQVNAKKLEDFEMNFLKSTKN